MRGAEAELPAGRRVTTHRAYGESLARRFPGARVDPAQERISPGHVEAYLSTRLIGC